jgi:adenylosuccinate lyase
MKKKRNLIATERTTIASVKKEMQKPRLTESVRNELNKHAESLLEEPSARPEKV